MTANDIALNINGVCRCGGTWIYQPSDKPGYSRLICNNCPNTKYELISEDLAQDTERLEWMIKHHVRITRYTTAHKDKHVYVVFIHNDEGFGVYSTHGNTPREAIDRAMRERP